MAASRTEEKRKRSGKKRKGRTQVEISSSESESDVPQQVPKKLPQTKPLKEQQNGDISMTNAHQTVSASVSGSGARISRQPMDTEQFQSIYLRKVTMELADDLDKVREAQDFKANSLPMLIHALKQGAGMYSTEEKRRVINAAGV